VLLLSGAAQPAQKPPVAPQARTFYFPADAVEVRDRQQAERITLTYRVRAGGSVTTKGGDRATLFVESGGSVTLQGGGPYVVVVQKGGKATLSRGTFTVFHEKGAEVHQDDFPVVSAVAYDSIKFAPLKPFTLSGKVTGRDGRPAAGVKVHAFGPGKFHAGTTSTAADGTFALRPAREVTHLAADLAPRWGKERPVAVSQDLDLRLHVRPLVGWEVEVVEGNWAADAKVDLAYSVKQPLTVTSRRLDPKRAGATHRLAFSPDGRFLAVGDITGRELSLWDVEQGKELPSPAGLKKQVKGVAFSPDGATLALGLDSGEVRLHRTATGESVRTLTGHAGEVPAVTFTLDGKTLLSGGKDGTVRTWDLASGQERGRFKAHVGGVQLIAVAPGGKALITGGDIITQDGMITFYHADLVRQWDPATGRELRKFHGLLGQAAFHPNGQLLATGGHIFTIMRQGNVVTETNTQAVSVRSLVSGEELFRTDKANQAVFSADGRLLVTAHQGGLVQFWELATGQEALRIPLPTPWAPGATLGLAGRRLASGGSGIRGEVEVWDLDWERVLPRPGAMPPGGWESVWADLAKDAETAYRAVARLRFGGEEGVAFLGKRLRPAAGKDLPLERLVADLNSPRFAAREAASRELVKLGPTAELALRQALEKEKVLEARRRLEGVLAALHRQKLTGEDLRQLRAVAALEWLATAEARRLLATLAQGWPAARQTQEARDAQERLSARATAKQ
jgi:WD40 repeat protein